MALIITFPIWRNTEFDPATYRCHEDWGMMKATIPTVPENERDLNDQMCIGNFHFSENYTSSCKYDMSGFNNSTFKMQRSSSNTTPVDLNISDDDFLSDIFRETSGKWTNTRQSFLFNSQDPRFNKFKKVKRMNFLSTTLSTTSKWVWTEKRSRARVKRTIWTRLSGPILLWMIKVDAKSLKTEKWMKLTRQCYSPKTTWKIARWNWATSTSVPAILLPNSSKYVQSIL